MGIPEAPGVSRVARNIIYNLSGQGLLLVLSLVAVRHIFRRLGEDALGIIYFNALMSSVLCSVLELGVCSTTVREVSGHSKSDPQYVKDLVRTFSLFYWAAYALLASGLVYFAPAIVERWINLKTMDSATAIYVLRILGTASLVALPHAFYTSLLRGLQRMEFNNGIDVVTAGLQQFGVILIIAGGGNVFWVVYWLAGCYVVRIVGYVAIAGWLLSPRALVPGYAAAAVRRNLGFASTMTVISVATAVTTQIDKLIISKLLPVAAVGYYGIAYGTASKGTLLTGAVSQAVLPSFSALSKGENRAALMSQYRKLQDLVCVGNVPIFAAILFAAMPVFSYALSPEVAQQLLLPTLFLCVGFYLNGSFSIPYMLSVAVGRPDITAKMNLLALFVVVPLTAVLIYFFGLTGAGLSWVAYHIFSYSYAAPRISSQCLGMPVRILYVSVLKLLGIAGVSYGVSWVLAPLVGGRSILTFVTAYVIGTLGFMGGAYLVMDEGLIATIVRSWQGLRTDAKLRARHEVV